MDQFLKKDEIYKQQIEWFESMGNKYMEELINFYNYSEIRNEIKKKSYKTRKIRNYALP